MSFGARREYWHRIEGRYKSASKSEKKVILNEFCFACGFNRKYASRLLRGELGLRKKKPGPKATYGALFVEVLYDLWQVMQRMCGKKMVAALPVWLNFYVSEKLTPEIRRQLLAISAAHIDRLLRPFKKIRGKSTTKPGAFLKAKIPLSISQPAAKAPGYLQGDTVAHCGSLIQGTYVHTLTLTDVFSNWTENRAIWKKGARAVLEQFLKIERGLPFFILGWSSDNGGEVMNDRLYGYLNHKGILIYRGRPYRKNDNPHVEQKNNTHVRRLFGYERLEHLSLVTSMNEIYEQYWNPLQNFFMPSQKLIHKERVGGRIIKKYDDPQTPYERVMGSSKVMEAKKMELKTKYESLNPILLSQGLNEKMKAFFKTVHSKRGIHFS